MADNRETRIHWLNWKDMYREAEDNQDDGFFDLSATFARRIESHAGEGNLLYWAGEDLCEDVGFDPTVMYHVRNTEWPWEDMMADLLVLSEEYPEVILLPVGVTSDLTLWRTSFELDQLHATHLLSAIKVN